MTEFGKSPQPSNYTSFGFRFSLLLHATLVLWLLAHWAAESFINTHDDEANKKLRPKKSIRVDVVDLPNLKFNELHKVDLTKEVQKTAVTEKPKEEVMIPPKPNPNAMQLPSKTKTKTASEKRLEEIQKNIRAEAKRQEILNKYKNQQKQVEEDARPALGGNIVSKGGSVQGDVADEADEFTATVQTHVRKFWKAPPWAAGQNYKVRVVVKIAPNGRVLSKAILRSSGRPEFDASAMEAVEAADPFPAPPEFFKRIIMNEGIECGFPD